MGGEEPIRSFGESANMKSSEPIRASSKPWTPESFHTHGILAVEGRERKEIHVFDSE
jgi:hypothetical protein